MVNKTYISNQIILDSNISGHLFTRNISVMAIINHYCRITNIQE